MRGRRAESPPSPRLFPSIAAFHAIARGADEGFEGFQPSLGSFFTFEKGTKKKTRNYVSGNFLAKSIALTFYRCRYANRS
jgi:hypothetical protein